MGNLGNPFIYMDLAVNLADTTSMYFQKTWATLSP